MPEAALEVTQFGKSRHNIYSKMKTHIKVMVPVVALLLAAGCAGTGPNTQRGAVGGGILGAVAGGMIGNNRGGGNGASGALIGAAVGALAGGTLGNTADHEQGTVYGSAEPEQRTEIIVDSPPPPPPPRQEVIYQRTTPDAVWVQGYWVYRRGGYAWVPGRWEVPPPQYHQYVAAHWQRRGRGYVYVHGYWQ